MAMVKRKFYWPAKGFTLEGVIYWGMMAILVGTLLFVGVGVLLAGHGNPSAP